MKVYRIWNANYKCWQYTNKSPNGFFSSLTTAKKALGQLKKRHKENCEFVLKEFELVNEKEIN